VTADAAIEFIRKHAKSSQPFFAVVWFGSPHGPHKAVERDRTLYDDQPERVRDFCGEITGMDRAFGKLRQELRDLDIQEDTILWYCSDNGGLRNLGATGGRGHKGQVYEGGLRVPAILEWPPRIPDHRATDIPCNTSDIYPTLLEIAGVRIEKQPPLDGVSLVGLIDGRMKARPRPMGFWNHPTRGIGTPSKEWMASLLKVQQDGQEIDDRSRLRLDAAYINRQYPEDTFPGHAAWLDWPWKLHRIDRNDSVRLELYNLADDPKESSDLSETMPDKVESMKRDLEQWLQSVVRSLNGKDYI
jgi:arylsulfatase A-like enzyme